MNLTLVVLAAGIGSRYGGLKQMDPMGPSGEFIIDYTVHDALRAGFNRVVFVVSGAIEPEFRRAIGVRWERRVSVDYVRQELDDLPGGFRVPADRRKPWGTAHAVYVCRHAVREPFAVVNADDFYGRESYRALADFLKDTDPNGSGYAMVGFELRNTLSDHGSVSRGICEVAGDGRLRQVTEVTKIERTPTGARYQADDGSWKALTGRETASMNLWGFTPGLFCHLEAGFPAFHEAVARNPKAEFFLPTHVDGLIRAGKATVRVLPTPEVWFGVTNPEDKIPVVARIRGLVDQGVYPESVWQTGA